MWARGERKFEAGVKYWLWAWDLGAAWGLVIRSNLQCDTEFRGQSVAISFVVMYVVKPYECIKIIRAFLGRSGRIYSCSWG